MPRNEPAKIKLTDDKIILQEFARRFATHLQTPRERGELAARELRYQAERDRMYAVLSKIYPSHIAPSAKPKPLYEEVICIHSPVGQLALGLSPERMELFAHLERRPCAYDNHTSADRYARLGKLAALPREQLLPTTTRSTRRPARRRPTRKGKR